MTDKELYRVGRSSPRIEDNRMIRGKGRFTDDLRLPRAASLVFVRSPHAAARILGVDADDARAMPGVLLVAAAEDVAADGLHGPGVLVDHPTPDGRPMFVPERIGLARDRVRYVGDPILAVFAETVEAARAAADCIVVDYDLLDPVSDLDFALAQAAPEIWPEAPGNVAFDVSRGDAAEVDTAFDKAARVVALDIRIPRVAANCLEPRAAVADWSAADERFTLHIGTHTPHGTRDVLARDVLGVPPGRLRVSVGDMGGSFGMREGGFPEYVVALWGARTLDRPVAWTAERSESLLADYHARDNLSHVELAFDGDAALLAMRVRTIANMGAYLSQAGSHVPVGNLGSLSGVYRIGAIHAEVVGAFTNTSPTAAYRGAGRPEATYLLERSLDFAARELGIDRLDLRRRNLIPAAAMPYDTGFLYTYDSGDFAANMDEALAAADWDGFAARQRESVSRGMLRGIGLANTIEIAGGPPGKPFEEDASLRFEADGSVTVHLGTKSHGQGHETAFTQIMVDRFDLAPDRIRIVTGDTDHLPNGRGSFGSRTTAAGGAALYAAADRVVDKARRIAADALEADAQDIEFRGGEFVVIGTDRSISLAGICGIAHDHMRLPAGEDFGLSAHASVSANAPTFPNGTHICEVEIDPETGLVAILRYVVVDDIGAIINPALADAQIHGGVAQGIGEAMLEEIRYDPRDGQLLTGSFQDYAMPRADDLPFIEIHSNPTATLANPLGVKGVGESGTVGAMPAFVNAVVHALEPFGIAHLDMPLTPLKVWEAIRAAKDRS